MCNSSKTKQSQKRVSGLASLILVASQSVAADIPAHKLKLVYSTEGKVCHEIARLLANDKACRHFDATKCSDSEAWSLSLNGKNVTLFEELGTNEYGYTQVARSTSTSGEKYSVVYLNQFQGDQQPRLVQTWKVDADALNAVLNLPPGPLPYTKWIDLKPRPPKETNSSEFADLLNHGEKISEEWSPVIEVLGGYYVIERECSGMWAFGGYYACNRVIKLTAKRLESGRPTIPMCQFAKVKK